MNFSRSTIISDAIKRAFRRELNENRQLEEKLEQMSEYLGHLCDGRGPVSVWEAGLKTGTQLPANTTNIWTSNDKSDGLYYWLGDETRIAQQIDQLHV